jgi:hypothetical protein
MSTAQCPSREIDGKGRTVCELLARRHSIDCCQREYRRRQRQVAERIWNPNRLEQEASP